MNQFSRRKFLKLMAGSSALLSASGLLSGCGKPDIRSSEAPMKTENTEDIAAVNKLAKDYAAAWAKGDPELLLACYADDAVVIMSHQDPIVGKESLRELYHAPRFQVLILLH